jgi:hypothetical protein
MEFRVAQQDIRRAYVHGGPGAMVSGLVWAIATGAIAVRGTGVGFTTLFLGGMAIFPLSKAVVTLGFRRAGEAKANGLGLLALESTIMMIGMLFVAWLLLPLRPEFVFPIAAMAVGLHYLPFRTVYGDRTFWAMGAAITVVGVAGVLAPQIRGLCAPLVAEIGRAHV